MTASEREIYDAAYRGLVAAGLTAEAAQSRALYLATTDIIPPPYRVGIDQASTVDPLERDKERRSRHMARWKCQTQEVNVSAGGGSFIGEYGDLLETDLKGRYTDGGDGRRLAMLRQITPTGYHFQTRCARAVSLLRTAPIEVTGDLATDEAFQVAWEASGFDDAAAQVEWLANCTGAAGLRASITPDGVEFVMVEAHNLSAWKREGANDVGVIVQHCQGYVIVYDWREPLFPMIRKYAGPLRRNLQQSQPMEPPLMGADVDTYWDGVAVMPIVLYQGAGTARGELLPVAPVVLEGTLEIVDMMRQSDWIGRVGMFPRLFMTGKVTNAEAANIEPQSIIGIEGADTILDKMESTARDMEHWDARVERRIALLGSQYHSGIQIQRTEGTAASGYALRLRTDDQWRERNRQEGAARPKDRQAIQAMLARWARWFDAPIPVLPFGLAYPSPWDPEEEAEQDKRLVESVQANMGDATPVDIVLRRQGGNPNDPEQRQAALETVLANAEELRILREAGLLVPHSGNAATVAAANSEPTSDESA